MVIVRWFALDQRNDEVPHPYMPHFLLTFGHARQPVAGIAIIEAPSMDQARMTAVLKRFASGVPFGEGLKLSAKLVASIPPQQIGRMLSGDEMSRLMLRLVDSRIP
jgi:hypothetical protein